MLRAIDWITSQEERMHIAAVGWMYVVLMMAITEDSVIAGIMTFFFYGVLPTLVIVYIGGSGQRRKRRELDRLQAMQERQQAGQDQPPGPT
jgi:predicted DNA repair protein MutK